MEVLASERRVARRLQFKTALRVRVWKSRSEEHSAESENLSASGIFFATEAPLAIGSAVEILVKMPEEITGKAAVDWRCTGRVVRIQPVDSPRGRLGVGVHFDCHEILRSKSSANS